MAAIPLRLFLDRSGAAHALNNYSSILMKCGLKKYAHIYEEMAKRLETPLSVRELTRIWRAARLPHSYGYGGPFDFMPPDELVSEYVRCEREFFRYF